MKVTVKPIGPKTWSGINQYRNCHTDIGTYWLDSGTKYTGLDKEAEGRLGEELGKDLKWTSDYWKTFFIRFTGEEIELDTDIPIQELQYHFLKGHKLVQASISEPKATAEYILVNEEAEARVENTRNKQKRKAFLAFSKLSATDIRKALRLYGVKAETVSAEQAENKLFALVEEDPNKFMELWVDNSTRETQFLIEAAISKNVMRKNKNAYYYGTDAIGYSLEDAIAFLDDPKNNDIKVAIINGTEIL